MAKKRISPFLLQQRQQQNPTENQVQTEVQPQGDDTLINLDQTSSSLHTAWDKYGKTALLALAAILVLVIGYFAYKHFVVAPKNKVAAEKMFKAQQEFEQDSFNNVLLGKSGSYAGMLDIVKNYGGTASGNLANYYTGIASLRNGMFDDAIKYLKDFSTDSDMIQAMAYGALGDAYGEKGDFQNSLSYYEKAYKHMDNEFSTPYYLFKAGMVQEQLGKPADAKALYERIKKEFSTSAEAADIEIALARVS